MPNADTKLELSQMNLYKPLIITGPSGVGKGTLIKNLNSQKYASLFEFSVSYTTRQARPGENDGTDYCFVSKYQFDEMVDKDEFIEYQLVHGNYYGTSKQQVSRIMDR